MIHMCACVIHVGFIKGYEGLGGLFRIIRVIRVIRVIRAIRFIGVIGVSLLLIHEIETETCN